MSEVLFGSIRVKRLEADCTLPAKFRRLLDRIDLARTVRGRAVCIKMHLGGNLGYTTIHPFFVRLLVDQVKEAGARDVFVADCGGKGCEVRGYTPETIGCRIVHLFRDGHPGTEPLPIGFRGLDEALVAREVLDADALLVFSHLKAHGACGFGGAIKNIAMGVVPSQTRGKIHALEGGIEWSEKLCTRCGRCLEECPNGANKFNDSGAYEIFFHNCTYCQHCILACPAGALRLMDATFQDFQKGLALVMKAVMDRFEPDALLYLNVLLQITIFCDCWGLSTAALVPDIGILGSRDPVALDRASLDLIRTEDLLLSGLPEGRTLGPGNHLFEQIHGKDPYVVTRMLEELGGGSTSYTLSEVE